MAARRLVRWEPTETGASWAKSVTLGRTLRWRQWWPCREGWDHDHCAFCQVDIADFDGTPEHPVERAGFVTEDDYHWVCKSCFDDFRERFNWTVAE